MRLINAVPYVTDVAGTRRFTIVIRCIMWEGEGEVQLLQYSCIDEEVKKPGVNTTRQCHDVFPRQFKK